MKKLLHHHFAADVIPARVPKDASLGNLRGVYSIVLKILCNFFVQLKALGQASRHVLRSLTAYVIDLGTCLTSYLSCKDGCYSKEELWICCPLL